MSGPNDDDADAKSRESSEDDSAGVGAHLTWIVLGTILAVVLAGAWRLHAFWWQ